MSSAQNKIRDAELPPFLADRQTFVDFDRGINFCINQIRAALDDDPRNPRYLETLC